MDKESKPAWNVLSLDANLGTVRCGGKLTVRLDCSESQLRVERTRSHTLEAAIPGSLTSLLPPSDRFKW